MLSELIRGLSTGKLTLEVFLVSDGIIIALLKIEICKIDLSLIVYTQSDTFDMSVNINTFNDDTSIFHN